MDNIEKYVSRLEKELFDIGDDGLSVEQRLMRLMLRIQPTDASSRMRLDKIHSFLYFISNFSSSPKYDEYIKLAKDLNILINAYNALSTTTTPIDLVEYIGCQAVDEVCYTLKRLELPIPDDIKSYNKYTLASYIVSIITNILSTDPCNSRTDDIAKINKLYDYDYCSGVTQRTIANIIYRPKLHQLLEYISSFPHCDYKTLNSEIDKISKKYSELYAMLKLQQ